MGAAVPRCAEGSPAFADTMPNQVLETPRLILREMSLDDLDFVAVMLAHPEVMRYYPKRYSRDEAEVWIERQIRRYARHGHGLWLAIEKATGEPVGQVGLLIQQVHGVEEKEVAYLIHRPFWRRGFATEAGAAARDYAFEVLGRKRVIALIRPENVPSIGVARKLGLNEEPDRIQHSGFEHIVFSAARNAVDSARADANAVS
jgi:[ribosomal protein S5]-alanine N-acetyltransferase